jgi:hypothetical protein
MEKYREDMKFGIEQEINQFDLIKSVLDANLKKSEKSNATFDYFSDNTLVELKSRRNKHNTYSTTMVGYNKIEYALKHPDKQAYFCFYFLDGLYYYKFSKDDKLEVRLGGRRDRGKDEIKEYCYIPISLLRKI